MNDAIEGEARAWIGASHRSGVSPVERKALGKLQHEAASMPASLVVQIALWPTKLADWARQEKVSPTMVYNCLANTKPYAPVRDRLAESLGVSRAAIDHLIEAVAPPPPSRVPPDPRPETQAPSEPRAPSRPRGDRETEGREQLAIGLDPS